MTKISRNLSLELLDATTADKIKKWIADVQKEVGTLTWLPVGGLKNNSLACDLSSGAMPALIERVTNAKDAAIEEAMILAGLTGTPPQPKSPREAAEILFGIRDNMDDTPAGTLAEVASKVVVSLHEGSEAGKPTTIVRDRGIGQHPDNFHSTLLSLCEDNKTDKPWLHGRYNAGSSASYKFAAATVVISRRNHEIEFAKAMREGQDAPEDEVGVSVVLYNKKSRPGPCIYMADKDGDILRLDLPEFEHGTEIRLVDYDIPKHNAKAAHATNSLRQAFFAHFVRPSMPFCISEHRRGMLDKSGNQKIYGLYHALEGQLSVQKSGGSTVRPSICVYKQSHQIPLGKMGSVTLKCFVLHEEAKQNYYVTADQAFCFSLNGQRQYNKERSWFRDIGFHNIFQRLIVVVECDNIDYDERFNIFKSDREGIVHTQCSEEIMDKVKEILSNDPDLINLEEEAKENKIKNSSGKVSESTISEIKRIIGDHKNIRGTGTLGSLLGTRTPPSGKKRSTDDSHLPDLPTELEIEKKPFNASRGSRLHLYVRLNCKNGYLPGPGRSMELVFAKGTAVVTSQSGLLGGSVRFDIKVPEDAPVGKHDFVVIFKDEENKIVLCDKSEIVIANPKTREETENKKSKDEGSADREVKVLWIRKAAWSEMSDEGWNESSVGECQESEESITFFLNRDNVHLERAGETGDFSEASWEKFLERYSLPVTTGLYAILKDETPATNERIENEKRRLAPQAVAAIRPELVHDAAARGLAPKKRHSAPVIRNEPATSSLTPVTANPKKDIRQNGTFIAEMNAVMEHRRGN